LRLADEEVQGRDGRIAAARAAEPVLVEEVVGGGSDQLGRRFTFRTLAGDVDD